jgi:hypothetical protein
MVNEWYNGLATGWNGWNGGVANGWNGGLANGWNGGVAAGWNGGRAGGWNDGGASGWNGRVENTEMGNIWSPGTPIVGNSEMSDNWTNMATGYRNRNLKSLREETDQPDRGSNARRLHQSRRGPSGGFNPPAGSSSTRRLGHGNLPKEGGTGAEGNSERRAPKGHVNMSLSRGASSSASPFAWRSASARLPPPIRRPKLSVTEIKKLGR